MSAHWFNWARRQPVPRSAAKFVLVMLGDAAAEDTGLGFCAVSTLSDQTALDRKTVLDSLARLQEWGFIADTGKRTGRTKQIAVYRLAPEPKSPENGTASESGESNHAENEARCGSQGDADPSNNEQSRNRDGSENGTALAALSSPEIGTASDGNSPEIPLEQSRKRDTERKANLDQKQKPRPSAGAPAREGEGLDVEQQEAEASAPTPFEAFWAIYPIQVARLDCERRWRRMGLDEIVKTIVDDVKRRKEHDPSWLAGKILYPFRYIDGRRWEDKPPGVAGSVAATSANRPSIYGNPMDPLQCEIAIIEDQFRYDAIDEPERDRLIAAARAKYAVPA